MTTDGTVQIDSALTDADLALEACLGLGARWQVDETPVPPLAAGHLVLMELVKAPLWHQESPLTMEAIRECMTIQMNGKACVQPLYEALSGDEATWEAMVADMLLIDDDNYVLIAANMVSQMQYAFGGLEMIHWQESQPATSTSGFDLSWLAHQAYCACNAVPSLTLDQALWEMPLAMVTHLMASTARSNGATLRRPQDLAGAFASMKEAAKDGS